MVADRMANVVPPSERAELRLTDEDEVSFRRMFALLWRRKLYIVVTTLITTLGALTAALVWPKSYTATVLVIPVGGQSTGSSELGALASQFGGLASLAGISIGSGSSTKAKAIALLESELLTERYIRENNLLPVLYASKWDAAHQRWKTADPDRMPTVWKANRYFKKKIRTLNVDEKTGLVTLTIAWTNPQQAAAWANGMVQLTNDYLRDKTLQECEREISYLNSEAANTTLVAAREGIYSLVVKVINKEMLAKGSTEYALEVVDPAVAPEKPSFPLPIEWTIIGFVGGLLLSTLIAIYA